ncbi:HNH endonuclease signature motif containing protein [Chryseobacterium sp.]|uniref:HNH endonuclease signature motif containing protein n=1 Tax=Chryseobacterium sp. TaxID=1871047 RepID=UPI002FCC80EB
MEKITKIQAIKKIILNNGGIADWSTIYTQIENYYPRAKISADWKEGLRGVLYRDKEIVKYSTGVFGLKNKQTWIIPCNIKKYDIEAAFCDNHTIDWTQNKSLLNLSIGDIIYIYVGGQIRNIPYKCEALEVNVKNQIDDTQFMLDRNFFEGDKNYFRIKLIKKMNTPDLSFEKLKANGLNGNCQGPQTIKNNLLKYIEEKAEICDEQLLLTNNEKHELCKISEEELEYYCNMSDLKSGYKETESLSRIRLVDKRIVEKLKNLYKGQCQLCGACVGLEFGENIVEAHHLEYFSISQNNDSSNIIIVCPNCHRIIHKCNFKFDREQMLFCNKTGQEIKITNPGHLKK